jgi:4-amino-4-deoxy-L-arabinose transferase-like glycosyltransferase
VKHLKAVAPFFFFFLAVLFVRSINLLGFSLYLDEGIYISWAKLINQSIEFAYVSLNDGKTPLFMWLVATISPWFSSSWLAGRFLSVVAGAITAVCWAIITQLWFGKKQRNFFMLFALITPYAFFVERMAFVDSLLTMFMSLGFLFWILTQRYIEQQKKFVLPIVVAWSFLSGLSLGLAYFTKTSARLFLIVQVVLGVVWLISFLRKKDWRKSGLMLMAIAIMAGVNKELISYMRVGAARFWMGIASKEVELTFSPKEIVHILVTNPMQYFLSFSIAFNYFAIYLVAILVLFVISFWVLFAQRKTYKKNISTYTHALWLFLFISMTVIASLLAGRVIASRYLYPVVPAILSFSTLAAFWLYEKGKWRRYALWAGLIVTAGVSISMLFAPLSFPYASDEIAFTHYDISALGLNEVIQIVDKPNSVMEVSGIWGVKDGSVVTLREAGIEAYGQDQIVDQAEPIKGKCPAKTTMVEESCWKLSSHRLFENPKPNKYLFLTDLGSHAEIVKQLPGVKVVREFQRPSDRKTYLLQLDANEGK